MPRPRDDFPINFQNISVSKVGKPGTGGCCGGAGGAAAVLGFCGVPDGLSGCCVGGDCITGRTEGAEGASGTGGAGGT